MEFIKVDTRYYLEDAMIAAGEKAEVLWMRAKAHCGGIENDGFIPTALLPRLCPTSSMARARALVREGLWVQVDGGFRFAVWDQITRDELEESRAAAAARKRKQRKRESQQESRGESRVTSDVTHTEVTRQEVEVEEEPSADADGKDNVGAAAPTPPEPPRPDVEAICTHLADRIEANGSKRPTITAKWRDAARLLLDRDHRTPDQVHRAIDWCQDHEFWRANVLSMPKLREKYDQLRLQAKNEPAAPKSRIDDHLDLVQRLAEQHGPAPGTAPSPPPPALPAPSDHQPSLQIGTAS